MRGKAVNQIDNFITIEIETDYIFKDQEPVLIKSLRNDYRDEIRALFFCLMEYIIRPENIEKMPYHDRKYIIPNDTTEKQKDLMSTIIRARVDYYEMEYNKNMQPVPVIKSLSNEKSKQSDLSLLMERAEMYAARHLDMDPFYKEQAAARERIGKYL